MTPAPLVDPIELLQLTHTLALDFFQSTPRSSIHCHVLTNLFLNVLEILEDASKNHDEEPILSESDFTEDSESDEGSTSLNASEGTATVEQDSEQSEVCSPIRYSPLRSSSIGNC